MSCPFYTDKGDIFKRLSYCSCVGKIDNNVWYKYCRDDSYKKCPNYVSGNSDSSGGCYLTSACVYANGLPDDCYELQTLRQFRDGWLKSHDNGENIIKRYYDIAPVIVSHICDLPEKKQIFNTIYETMIFPCVKLIEEEKYSDAKALYLKKTLELESKYVK